MPAKRLQHAFTLIELLAVLAVIALMLSVVLPALRQAKEAARTVQCKTLMKNYALAFYSYFWQTNTLFPLSIQDWQNNIRCIRGILSMSFGRWWIWSRRGRNTASAERDSCRNTSRPFRGGLSVHRHGMRWSIRKTVCIR